MNNGVLLVDHKLIKGIKAQCSITSDTTSTTYILSPKKQIDILFLKVLGLNKNIFDQSIYSF